MSRCVFARQTKRERRLLAEAAVSAKARQCEIAGRF